MEPESKVAAVPAEKAFFQLRNVRKVYQTGVVETTALAGISLDIREGEFVCVMGPSGCGKTTLLNVVAMLDTPTSGSYVLGEVEVSNASESRLAEIRKGNIGFIFQHFMLLDDLSVYENVELPLRCLNVSRNKRQARVREVLELVDLQRRAKHRPLQLSGGQQQRVAIARAVVGDPKLIVADEPTGNLDSHHGEEVMDMLTTLNQQGTTILMVTHSHSHADRASQTRSVIEMRIKRDGVKQMEQAVEQLDAGLKVVNDAIEGLAVRAPIAGRLTDFRLQLGEIVKSEQRIGRIDDPTQFKLTAQIDEYFLGSVSTGKKGSVNVNGHDYAVEVSRVFPQITDGRFLIELLFTGETPQEMNPGQSAETRLTLGGTSRGLILPNDAFLNDTGGAWVFVLARDGQSAERHEIRIGRRNSSQLEVVSGLAPGERVIVSTYSGFGKAERLQIGN